jgi:hypothetical protein
MIYLGEAAGKVVYHRSGRSESTRRRVNRKRSRSSFEPFYPGGELLAVHRGFGGNSRILYVLNNEDITAVRVSISYARGDTISCITILHRR